MEGKVATQEQERPGYRVRVWVCPNCQWPIEAIAPVTTVLHYQYCPACPQLFLVDAQMVTAIEERRIFADA